MGLALAVGLGRRFVEKKESVKKRYPEGHSGSGVRAQGSLLAETGACCARGEVEGMFRSWRGAW